MMTQYCSSKIVKANRSVEQEVIRQRDTAEVKAHMLKTRLSAVKSVNRQVTACLMLPPAGQDLEIYQPSGVCVKSQITCTWR